MSACEICDDPTIDGRRCPACRTAMLAHPAPSTPGNADKLRDAIEVLVRQHFGPGSITSGGAVSTPAGYEFATAVVGLLAALSPPEQVGGEAEWLREGTTVYQLHQKGWRLGKPVMVNRVTVQVTVDPTSDLDALTVAEQVRAALSPPPMSPADSGGGWREALKPFADYARVAQDTQRLSGAKPVKETQSLAYIQNEFGQSANITWGDFIRAEKVVAAAPALKEGHGDV